ncbi:SAYSvFN domain-containing protein 1-like [Penaeus monodon]|uniref:SAYSvFN domain-containing protein 1-like n=1 Tax=Penaeus monodon TaxID=6687 RepID=UPI0018A788DA|nr:SAYSvFN domain-containing protein 1-like [Penaeus monodon]
MHSTGKSSIEEQLAQYRLRKKREDSYKDVKKRFWELLCSAMSVMRGNSTASEAESSSSVDDQQPREHSDVKELRKRLTVTRESSSGTSADHSDADSAGNTTLPSFSTYTKLDWIALGLKCAMWLILFKIFILLEFGAVFFIFSAFAFIWYNMRSEPKKKGEISAYSVFNPNCETIDGTLSAEQFEREILHKM